MSELIQILGITFAFIIAGVVGLLIWACWMKWIVKDKTELEEK